MTNSCGLGGRMGCCDWKPEAFDPSVQFLRFPWMREEQKRARLRPHTVKIWHTYRKSDVSFLNFNRDQPRQGNPYFTRPNSKGPNSAGAPRKAHQSGKLPDSLQDLTFLMRDPLIDSDGLAPPFGIHSQLKVHGISNQWRSHCGPSSLHCWCGLPFDSEYNGFNAKRKNSID